MKRMPHLQSFATRAGMSGIRGKEWRMDRYETSVCDQLKYLRVKLDNELSVRKHISMISAKSTPVLLENVQRPCTLHVKSANYKISTVAAVVLARLPPIDLILSRKNWKLIMLSNRGRRSLGKPLTRRYASKRR